MSASPTPEERARRSERARRRARIFGDVLPEATDRRDENDPTEGDADRGDDWLRANVPPHHE